MRILYPLYKLILFMIALTMIFSSVGVMFLWMYPLVMYNEFKLAWLLTLPIGVALLIFFISIFNWEYLTQFKYEEQ
jgi:low affinity Fe/Cu permease